MARLYKDRGLSSPVEENVILENDLYYVDFETHSPELIWAEIERSKLARFISWHPKNRVGTVKITNFVGFIRIFGNTYDVRTKKFLPGLTGKQQFEFLLNELVELCKDIIFSYSSPASAMRQLDPRDLSPSLLVQFNYFKQIILDFPPGLNLSSLFQEVLRNLHAQRRCQYDWDYTWKQQRADHRVMLSLVQSNRFHVRISPEHVLSQSPFTKFLSQNSDEPVFPLKSRILRKYVDYDTEENRFIKYFFENIRTTCLAVKRIENLPEDVYCDVEKLLSFVRRVLCNEFFSQVGNLKRIPDSSSVMLNRSGYREIYGHYICSKFGVIHLFDEVEREAMFIDLKDISLLYEYWVFYKIAREFLGQNIRIDQSKAVVKEGMIRNAAAFNSGETTVFYNLSLSRGEGKSYSVTLRPDIFVRIDRPGKEFNFLFDAKYRTRELEANTGDEDMPFVERTFKLEDLYKMHCYLDAIGSCRFSVAVYPGTEFRFYEKDVDMPVRKKPSEIGRYEGVGAVPLLPGFSETDAGFSAFVAAVRRSVNSS